MNDISPDVTVLLDPSDDAAVTRAALAGHDPAAGCVTVHPAPGTTSDRYFAHDLLAALGKPAHLPGFPDSRAPVWEAVTAWLAAISARRLTVLRAHLLTRTRLQRLLDLRAFTAVHLVLVCHRSRPTAALRDALTGVPHTLVQASAAGDLLAGPAVPGPGRPAAPPRAAGRWITVPALQRLADWDGSDHCIGCVPPPIRWRYRTRPRPRSSPTAAEIARRIHGVTAHPRLAAALAAAVFTGAAGQQLGTARLADWREDASTLALHDPLGQIDGCATHPVPAWATAFLRAAARFTRLTPAPGVPLLIRPEEHPGLLRLAEQARLRPPQPSTGIESDTVPARGIEWFYRELMESGMDAEVPQPTRPRLRVRRVNKSSVGAP
ncbi:hypothetical protein PV409_37995 [Streptomyces sp. ME02-6979.5a]|uniref:hypothetical protein n=1 Tax=Streptomyces TaxID=1883 RepID=UPI0029AECF8A|nr:hypothetical protein [Streptomyces sp. ME02-6979.5a]MDX3343747.1 hypothetical protein [Streptomyces sp. ME02-6979.5a]